MKHRVGLVTYESQIHAWVLDLVGCIVGGRNVGELSQTLPLAIAEYATWSRGHGESVDDSCEWEIEEEVDGKRLTGTGGEFCFDADREPLPRAELEVAVARMEHSRADLLDAAAGLPDVVLDWTPPQSATASVDPWAPAIRTIREILTHVLQFEAYYRAGLCDGNAGGIFERVGEPAGERSQTLALLRALPDGERGRVYRPVRPSRHEPEEWTVRKLLRRIISHERAHTAEIVQRRTWILLGVPHR